MSIRNYIQTLFYTRIYSYLHFASYIGDHSGIWFADSASCECRSSYNDELSTTFRLSIFVGCCACICPRIYKKYLKFCYFFYVISGHIHDDQIYTYQLPAVLTEVMNNRVPFLSMRYFPPELIRFPFFLQINFGCGAPSGSHLVK